MHIIRAAFVSLALFASGAAFAGKPSAQTPHERRVQEFGVELAGVVAATRAPRVAIIGRKGSGRTTMSKVLAADLFVEHRLNTPHALVIDEAVASQGEMHVRHILQASENQMVVVDGRFNHARYDAVRNVLLQAIDSQPNRPFVFESESMLQLDPRIAARLTHTVRTEK